LGYDLKYILIEIRQLFNYRENKRYIDTILIIGTDFDLFSLSNGNFNSGNGKVIYDWLTKHAHKFGFCQPYTAGRTQGYNEERW